MFDVGNVAFFLWISFIHCWALYLCYLGSQIWDHRRDPNVGHGAKKTRISWQEGRTGRRGLFPSEREVGAAERSRLWSLCWKLPQICGLIQILILLPALVHWVSFNTPLFIIQSKRVLIFSFFDHHHPPRHHHWMKDHPHLWQSLITWWIAVEMRCGERRKGGGAKIQCTTIAIIIIIVIS